MRHRREGRASLPATCGELVQGTLDGTPCLVSCPIDWYATARVRPLPDGRREVPADAPKASAALSAGLDLLGLPATGAHLRLEGGIPRGRGYGSSTADIGAVLYATADAFGRELSARDVVAAAVSIEPSDSTPLPGLALLAHRCGSRCEHLGSAPRMWVVVLDPGGEVDTVAYNRRDLRRENGRLSGAHREAFAMLREGLAQGDRRLVGAAATLSARTHQAILFSPLLEPAMSVARAVGALGVCRAHSGTLVGLLLEGERTDVRAVCQAACGSLAGRVEVASYRMVEGGPCTLAPTEAIARDACAR